MSRAAVLTILSLAFLCPPALAGEASPATQPAAATQPTEADLPSVSPERISQLVAQLGSDRYKLRLAAQVELRKSVNVPGAGELLEGHLKAATDPEIRAALEGILDRYGQPLVMVWCRATATASGRSFVRQGVNAAAPWLFIKGDGSFIYGPTQFMFSGYLDSTGLPEWRQGKLDPRRLWRLKEAIEAYSKAEPAEPAAGGRVTGAEVAFYVRSGSRWLVSFQTWTQQALGLTKQAPPAEAMGEQLPVLLRELVTAAPSRPYEGPWCLSAQFAQGMPREEAEKVPDWPIQQLPIQMAMGRGGVKLDEKQLAEVRAVLAEANQARGCLYKYARFAACRVQLLPYVQEALDLYYGPGP